MKNSTSGSTGSNFYFFSDTNEELVSKALELRKYDMLGGSLFDRELIIWGSVFDVEKSENQRLSRIKDWCRNKKVVSGYNLSDNDLQNIYNTMQSYKPLIIKSYPSILMTICEYFKKQKLVYKPNFIHIGGEKLFDFQRDVIENTFRCPVYDFYGARDMSQIALNCQEKMGLHVFMENVIVEVVDDDGNAIEDGEGDLVITDLHNYVMPFIRYRIGDRARVSQNKKCKCNRGLQLIDEVIGRTFEIIKFPNGNRVGGTFWTLVMKSVPGIKDFQVIHEKYDTIKINFTPMNNEKINFNIIKENIHRYSGNDLKIDFNQVANIAVTKSGKMQFVISIVN
jgi:phenylacetate-CoA ligase